MEPHYYNNWTDENGDRYDPARILKQATHNGISHDYLTTPKVAQVAAAHFSCSDLEGAPVENQGIPGSVGSHWERRFFGDEFMTASVIENPAYSAMTFALFEDTGWYKVDYDWAHPLNWGAGAGCQFFDESCV